MLLLWIFPQNKVDGKKLLLSMIYFLFYQEEPVTRLYKLLKFTSLVQQMEHM